MRWVFLFPLVSWNLTSLHDFRKIGGWERTWTASVFGEDEAVIKQVRRVLTVGRGKRGVESWRWGGEREGLSLDGGEGEERGRDWRLHLITHQVKKNSGWLLDMQQITRQGRHWLSWGRLLKAQVHCGRKSGLGAGWLDRLILSGSERGRFSHPHHLGNGLRGFNLSYMVQRRF